jgi:uncharacterized membrane protein
MTKKIFSVVGLSLAFLFITFQSALAEWDPYLGSATGLPDATIYDIITNILDWLLTIIGIVGVIAFAIAGIMYLTSAGNDDQVKKAKTAMVNSIIGVIVAIIGVVVLNAVDTMLNAGYLF